MGYNLLTNGVYWGSNPITNHLLTSWDIQEWDPGVFVREIDGFPNLLLMATRSSGEGSPVEGVPVASSIVYDEFSKSQVIGLGISEPSTVGK